MTGFEPLDLLTAILMVVRQLKKQAQDKHAPMAVENQYSRIVPEQGNLLAQKALAEFC